MRQIYLLTICLFTFGILSAQEENLSKEEKERREKNIQAGNPFAKYGYKAKVATLSKGKYLEVHDLDSIVTIGTIRWNVNQNKIVGNIVQDTTDMYAQPIGDTAGRWLSPDPLSDEFPEWSPYTSMNDNPITFVDPTGMAAEWIPNVTDDGTVSYIAEAGDSAQSMADQFDVDLDQAEAITDSKGTDVIDTGTSVSGEKVASVTGNEVMKLDLNNSTVTGADIANQAIFSVRNEFINDSFWSNGGNGNLADWTVNGADYFSGIQDFSSKGAGGSFYGIDTQSFANTTINGQSLKVWVSITGFKNPQYSNFIGNSYSTGSGTTSLEFFSPKAYPDNPYQGGSRQSSPIMKMITNKPDLLSKYLSNGQ